MKVEEEESEIDEDMEDKYKEIKRRKAAFRESHLLKKNKTAYKKNKSMAEFKEVLERQGIDPSLAE